MEDLPKIEENDQEADSSRLISGELEEKSSPSDAKENSGIGMMFAATAAEQDATKKK